MNDIQKSSTVLREALKQLIPGGFVRAEDLERANLLDLSKEAFSAIEEIVQENQEMKVLISCAAAREKQLASASD